MIDVIEFLADLFITPWRVWWGVVAGGMVGFVVWAFVPGSNQLILAGLCIALGFVGGLFWEWSAEKRDEQV